MSKHRKQGTAQPPPPPLQPTPANVPLAVAAPARGPRFGRIVGQSAALVMLGAVLGFAFNTANPIGVRFGSSDTDDSVRAGAAPQSTLKSTSNPTVPTAPRVARTAPPPPPPLPPDPTRPLAPAHTPPLAPTPAPVNAPVPQPPAPSAPPVAATAPAQTNANPAPIHWREAKPLVAAGQAVLVDVRVKPVFDAGHIPGALSLPELSSPEEFAAFAREHPTNQVLIVYCSSTSCSQSQRVATRLVQQFHYAAVKYMTGGYLEYQQEELAKAPSAPQP